MGMAQRKQVAINGDIVDLGAHFSTALANQRSSRQRHAVGKQFDQAVGGKETLQRCTVAASEGID
jgi:hypothetical protein